MVFRGLPVRDVTGGSGMDKLERVESAMVSMRDVDFGNVGGGENIEIRRML